jgi:hypothetical protein
MHILYTNNTLEKPAGTEISTRDAALAMLALGYRVSAFSCQLGQIAGQLADAGVHVTDDVRRIVDRPDVIHGHHRWETSVAALRWPGVPLLSFCRGMGWQEAPCEAPWVFRYLGVDTACVDRMRTEFGIPAERVALLPNGVDLERFSARPPLPERPRRALVLSNYATLGEDNYFAAVTRACGEAGLECEAYGAGVGKVTDTPESLLRGYDLVFAKGKVALEALGVGCGVIVCDTGGIGPFVTGRNVGDLRARSFYWGCLEAPVTAVAVAERLRDWNVGAATAATAWVRAECGTDVTLAALEAMYQEAITSPRAMPPVEELSAFASAFLADVGLPYKLGVEVQALAWQSKAPKGDRNDPYEKAKEWARALNRCRKGLLKIEPGKK